MDPDAASRGSAEGGDRDRRRSRDVADHVGYLTILVSRWRRSGRLATFERDEILSVAYLEADRLLRTKYDPTRSTATTFLSRFLLGRTSYAIMVAHGQRKSPDGWHQIAPHAIEDADDVADPTVESPDLRDLIEAIHPDLRDTARRLAAGEPLDAIAAEYAAAPLFESLLREEVDDPAATLRHMLRTELLKALR